MTAADNLWNASSGARQKITAITDGVYSVLLSVFIVLEKCISVNGGVGFVTFLWQLVLMAVNL